MSAAPMVWAVVDARGQVTGAVFEHHEDAIIDCEMSNETIRANHAAVHVNCCSIKSFPFIPNQLK